jgi:hypothetical protein
VPSEAWLVEFIKKAGTEMGLTHWYGVPEEYYQRGQPFDISQLPPSTREIWLAGMQKYGEHNEAVKNGTKD